VQFLLVLTCVSFLATSVASAAPPTLTYLFPAGAQRGTTVELTAAGTFERWPVQAWINGKGIEVKPARDKGKLTITVAADVVPGTYWLRLFDAEGASALRPFLVGTLPEVLEQEPNDDFKRPQQLASSSVVNGRLEKPGDVDCFALKLRKAQTLVASLEANRTLGSPMDGILQVLSADGFVLEQNNDFHGLDPQVAFTAPKDGTYVVRTFAFPAQPDASIRFMGADTYIYRLTLTTGGFADHVFPLAVTRTAPGVVELVGWNIPDAARKLTVKPGDERDSYLVHPEVANAVPIRVELHATISQDRTNDHQHPQTIPLPATISGRLERPADVHAYRFEAEKGRRLTIQAEAQTLGFPLTPTLHLTDADGKSLAQAAPAALGRDPELAYTVPRDGLYQVELRDLHAGGGARHLYRLRVVFAEPDFELKLATDRFTLTPGKPLDIPVTIDRRNGFNGEVEVVAEGLPEGVNAAVAPAGATAKSVMLRLTGGGTVSGPFRVLGKSKDSDPRTRSARATVAALNASTADLWLTVAPAGPAK
jgi:hypothetical protein